MLCCICDILQQTVYRVYSPPTVGPTNSRGGYSGMEELENVRLVSLLMLGLKIKGCL